MRTAPWLEHAAALTLLVVAACDTATTDPVPVTDLEQLEGIWERRGYAQMLEIHDGQVTDIHVTAASCVRTESSDYADVFDAHDSIVSEGTRLSWHELGHFTRADFDRVPSLPSSCMEAGALTDPVTNFEALWRLFAENYAYFEVRGVDWDQMHLAHVSQVDADTSGEALFGVFQEMLSPLSDGHVWVYDGEAMGFLSGSFGAMWERWAAQYDGEPVTNPIDPRRDFIVDMQHLVLEDVLGGEGSSGLHGTLHWGWLNDEVAYLDVHEMAFSDGAELTIPQMQDEVDTTMALVMEDLGGAEAFVIDARFNQGGRDTMGFAIAGWFTDEEVIVARKRAVDQGGWTEDQDVFVAPRTDAPFLGPIRLLTSGNTVSAAETFTMAMSALPNTVRVGTATYGAFSDVLVRQLPNGWLVGLSNEVYEAPDGSVYEAIGFPPDLEVAYDDALSFEGNLQLTLDAAVAGL
ncbi:MAG: S41 family peptidase [Nannocystales bacterium]